MVINLVKRSINARRVSIRYMEALMTHEIVRVKIKSTGAIKIEEVPEAYKERFIKAEQFMEYVNEKVR